MGAGLIQLVTTGQLDNFITTNPDISFYLFAYKRHTKFALETVRLDFDKTLTINSPNTIYKCKIPFIADMISNVYLVYTIPDIYSNDTHCFKWVKNFGTLLIKNANVTVASTIIDNLDGEWLLIMNELSLAVKDSYNNITGNINHYYDPQTEIPIIKIRNNRYVSVSYPSGNKDLNIPSIKTREIIIPLSFNFTKHSSLALLLARIQNREDIYINLELEDIENLYQVYDIKTNMYISPKYHNELYPTDKIDINTFITNNNLNAYIEATCVYIDNYERTVLMTTPVKSILIEKVFISNYYDVTAGNNLSTKINLMGANNHNKEIIWVLKREDYYKYNENINYTNAIPEDPSKPIMSMANIYFDKMNIMQDKNENFFNLIQPYQHHSCIPKKGIYCYSFGLFPDRWQPTGSYNGASTNTSLYVYANNADNTVINNKLALINQVPYTYNYKLRYYIRNYNILEYINGTVGIKYV